METVQLMFLTLGIVAIICPVCDVTLHLPIDSTRVDGKTMRVTCDSEKLREHALSHDGYEWTGETISAADLVRVA